MKAKLLSFGMASPDPAPKYDNKALWFWALRLFGLQLAFLTFFPFDGLFGQDSYGYLNDANALIRWMNDGTAPPDFFWTRGYSGLGTVLGMPFGNAYFPLALISILGHIGITLICIRWAEQLFPGLSKPARFIGLTVAFSPFLFRNGLSIQSDIFAIFWLVLGAWQSDSFCRTGKVKHLAWATLGLGYAVAVRYAMIPLAMLPALRLAFEIYRLKKWSWSPLLLLAIIPFIPDWFIFPGATASLQHGNVNAWSPLNFFRTTFVNIDGNATYPYPNLVYLLKVVWNPGFLGIGAAVWMGLLWVFREVEWKKQVFLTAPVLLYFLLIGGIPFQNDRFLLPAVPFLAIFLFPVWEGFWLRLQDYGPVRLARVPGRYVTMLFALSLAWAGPRGVVQHCQDERAIATALREQHLGKRIYTLGSEAMLQYRVPEMQVVSMFADSIPPPAPGDLLLTDLQITYPQWKDMAPARHFDAIRSSREVVLLSVFESGTQLSEIR